MTSGEFQTYPTAQVTVVREGRQRSDLTGIDELAASIDRVGLIHPIVIDHAGTLIAGERRLEAIKSLGWSHLSVQFVEDLHPEELLLIELEENVKRKQLPWKDECDAINSYHELQKTFASDWSQAATARCLGISTRDYRTRWN